MNKAAVVVSAVLHPLIMPLACVFVASRYDWFIQGTTSPEQIRLVYIIVALSTIAFPGLNMLLLRWYGVLRNLEMPKNKQRYAPFISTIFFFALGYYMLRKGVIPNALYSVVLGSIIALIALTLINFRYKVSAHAAGIFGLIGTVLGLFQLHDFGNIALLSVLLLCGGAVITSRILLGAHTPGQAYTGAAIGFLSVYMAITFEWVV
jgi:membrane-associated phospholipid phosphatase